MDSNNLHWDATPEEEAALMREMRGGARFAGWLNLGVLAVIAIPFVALGCCLLIALLT